jgi:hypothetical protein
MYEIIETTQGWLVCWGPLPQEIQETIPESAADAKVPFVQVEMGEPARMGWELYGV